jgi:predicted metal-dependent enzyme (double-stranded beta helix superfamily)
MFSIEQFIADCLAARAADASHKAVREVVARAVAEPGGVLKALGEPKRAELQTLYRSDQLTILNLVWGPHMQLPPHNHNMWAVIGVYTGREDNVFWRRLPGTAGKIEAAGARALAAADAVPLGPDIIHSVINPIDRLTGALHVYGGDFFGVERSEWDPESLLEGPLDAERTKRRFDEANRALAAL